MVFLYIDPGAGSLVIQALIAALLAVPFFFRSVISRGLARLRDRGDGGETPGGDSTDPS
jgi:hypothetical protein